MKLYRVKIVKGDDAGGTLEDWKALYKLIEKALGIFDSADNLDWWQNKFQLMRSCISLYNQYKGTKWSSSQFEAIRRFPKNQQRNIFETYLDGAKRMAELK